MRDVIMLASEVLREDVLLQRPSERHVWELERDRLRAERRAQEQEQDQEQGPAGNSPADHQAKMTV